MMTQEEAGAYYRLRWRQQPPDPRVTRQEGARQWCVTLTNPPTPTHGDSLFPLPARYNLAYLVPSTYSLRPTDMNNLAPFYHGI